MEAQGASRRANITGPEDRPSRCRLIRSKTGGAKERSNWCRELHENLWHQVVWVAGNGAFGDGHRLFPNREHSRRGEGRALADRGADRSEFFYPRIAAPGSGHAPDVGGRSASTNRILS